MQRIRSGVVEAQARVAPGAFGPATLWMRLALALFGLNLALSFHNVWPTPWITSRHELSVEAAAVVLALALAAHLGARPTRRALGVLAALLTLMTLGRYAEVTAPALYGRPVNLYWDAQHLPEVAAMLAETVAPWQSLALGLGALLVLGLLGLLYLCMRALLGMLSDALRVPVPRRVAGGLAGLLLMLFTASHLLPQVRLPGWFSIPVSLTYAQQVVVLRAALAADPGDALQQAPDLPPSSLTALAGADVLVVFLESYGATVLDREDHAAALAPARARLDAALRASGRTALSARVRSPTFGGASWLAHASFLAGVEVNDAGRYQQLLTRRRDTLAQRFAAQGYRTVAVMPGLRSAWPEGRFYGFDSIHDASALAYRGPDFGWWRIPDQYALARLHEMELAPGSRRPVFAVFPTISTHMPFRPTPPYQPDWAALLGDRPYAQLAPGAMVELDRAGASRWTELATDYLESMDYALTTLAGYVQDLAARDLALIIIGDHQPAASVTGPGASWDVPVHVITGQPALLAALREAGFADGLRPGAATLLPMHELAARLLGAFDGGGPGLLAAAPATGNCASAGVTQPRVDVAAATAVGQGGEVAAQRRCVTPAAVQTVRLTGRPAVAVTATRLQQVHTVEGDVTGRGQALEGQRRQCPVQTAQHLRLVALDVDLDEGRLAVCRDEFGQRGHRHGLLRAPADPGETRIPTHLAGPVL